MSELFTGTNVAEAWCAVGDFVVNNGPIYNALVEISHPCELKNEWLEKLDPAQVSRGADPIGDVANTIFPPLGRSEIVDPKEFINHYTAVYLRGQRLPRNRNSWGTYFLRLVDFGDSHTDQLWDVIRALSDWRTRAGSALVLHLSSANIDKPRRIGAPCWQFAEFLWRDDGVVDLVAVYRNHDYFAKALGNFVGLGRMLQFVCDAATKTPGKLICHSVHAYHSGSKAQMRTLIERCR